MIRLRLGRRVSAFALSFLLLSASVLPASASSGQLQTVGWAETVSSFLMASGIYPFESDEETGYQEWSVSSLKALWDEFLDDTSQVAYDIVDLTGSLVKGIIAIASGRWSVLREFATWIVSKYSVTDNQSGVELGEMLYYFLPVPSNAYYGPSGTAITQDSYSWNSSNGLHVFTDANGNIGRYSVDYNTQKAVVFASPSTESDGSVSYLLVVVSPSGGRMISTLPLYGTTQTTVIIQGVFSGLQSPYDTLYFARYTNHIYVSSSAVLAPNIPVVNFSDGLSKAFDYFNTGSDGSFFQGVTANTTTVSIPDALPEGEDFGGLVVAGAGANVTLEQLQTIIQTAVTESLQPLVTPVGVVVAPSVDLTPGGEIVETPVEITPGDIPLQSSDYSVPNLTSVFPFSIPWDIMSIYSALNAEPVRPSFDANVYIPVLDTHVPFHIGVTDETADAVDNAMALWRNMLLILLCVGTLWFFWGHFGG